MAKEVPTTLLTFGEAPRRSVDGSLHTRTMRNWTNFRRFRLDPVNPFVMSEIAKANIVHIHQTYTMMSGYCALLARLLRKPVFTTDLGGFGFGFHQVVDTTDWFVQHLHVSEFSRRLAGHERLASAQVIYGGVDPNRFRPDGAARPTGEVLIVARLLPHKGID